MYGAVPTCNFCRYRNYLPRRPLLSLNTKLRISHRQTLFFQGLYLPLLPTCSPTYMNYGNSICEFLQNLPVKIQYIVNGVLFHYCQYFQIKSFKPLMPPVLLLLQLVKLQLEIFIFEILKLYINRTGKRHTHVQRLLIPYTSKHKNISSYP